MKPTSWIFLALSVILFVGGFLTCGIAKSMANNGGIRIYDQEINAEGDSVYTYNISDENITTLSLVFSDVDINIIGNAESSYVELKNFDVNSYKATLSGSSVTINGTVGFLSSLVDMSGGGIQFKGLRYFLLDKPNPERPKIVNIYISENSGLIKLKVTSEKGTVYCKNLSNAIDYYVTVNDSDIIFDKIDTISIAELKTTNGNISVTTSEIATLSVNIESGNLTIESNGAYSGDFATYNLITAEGNVIYNGNVSEKTPGELKITSPAQKCLIKAIVTSGNITVNDSDADSDAP